jgi:hypothetical protein
MGDASPFYTSTLQYLSNDIKKILEVMGFDPCNRALKVCESIEDSNSQHGSSLWSVRVHSLTLFGTPESV